MIILISGNYLHDLSQLYTFDFKYLEDERFCNIQPTLLFNSSENSNHSISQSLNLNLKNNAWKCSCKTFELINTILKKNEILNESSTFKNSCYLEYFLKQNSFINLHLSTNLTCFVKTNIHNKNSGIDWMLWYKENCYKKIDSSNFLKITSLSPNISTQMMETTLDSSSKSTILSLSTNLAPSNFNFDWLSTFYFSNTTRTTNILKYDVSSAFYWISSICIAVITLSCLFAAWFYCWRRYNFSAAHSNRQRSTNMGNEAVSRRNGIQYPPQRRNLHFFNARFNNPAFSKLFF